MCNRLLKIKKKAIRKSENANNNGFQNNWLIIIEKVVVWCFGQQLQTLPMIVTNS